MTPPSAPSAFAYAVWQVQRARVTFVNGQWQGDRALSDLHPDDDPLTCCPLVWDRLASAGADGWELVCGLLQPSPDNPDGVQHLYLKRPLP
jgi:hypothetical protein